MVQNYHSYIRGEYDEMPTDSITAMEGGLKVMMGISDFSLDNKDLNTYLDHLNSKFISHADISLSELSR